MNALLLIPSRAKTGIDAAVREDRHPSMDYYALAEALASGGGGDSGSSVTLIDYAAVDAAAEPAVRLARRFAGRDAALAALGLLRSRQADAVFTNGENVAIPLALLFRLQRLIGRRRPGHVTIGHRLSTGKKRLFFGTLGLHREMDAIFVYATVQEDCGRERLGIPASKLRRIPFHADHRFYRPAPDSEEEASQVCAAGLEWRDYLTLTKAAAALPDVTFSLAAASPWSKHDNELQGRALPENVSARRYEYGELRDLYARSAVVAVPLYENDFQAGVTTILEAMAMGKPVVVTQTTGQTDVVVDGVNGVMVPPGDAAAWERTLKRLLADPAERRRLGRNARRWLEENATLDNWVEAVAGALRESCRSAGPAAKGTTEAAAPPPRDMVRQGAGPEAVR